MVRRSKLALFWKTDSLDRVGVWWRASDVFWKSRRVTWPSYTWLTFALGGMTSMPSGLRFRRGAALEISLGRIASRREDGGVVVNGARQIIAQRGDNSLPSDSPLMISRRFARGGNSHLSIRSDHPLVR